MSMIDNVIIRAEGLGKKYVIGHAVDRERYVALRDTLARGARNLRRSAMDILHGRPIIVGDEVEEFWALKDVDFEIKRGDVVGVVGRNGAGKSTLLKILSRITEPSEGHVTIVGRVASLLEVGTGFHPELTGRENIYLNGSILGMSRSETRRKFDEIVSFAETERFLDTPVKRYSSGMYVRLAFAVAAHLEPDILIVDEVLAVGDASFRQKCLGKLSQAASAGRTVIFVSHNLQAVTSLCSTGILLKNGRVQLEGPVSRVVTTYLNAGADATINGKQIDVSASLAIVGSPPLQAVTLHFEITLRGPLESPHIGLGINDFEGKRIATILSETAGRIQAVFEQEVRTFCIDTEPVRLSPGSLFIKVALADYGEEIEAYDDALHLVIEEYSLFDFIPHTRPNGPLLIRHRLHVYDQ